MRDRARFQHLVIFARRPHIGVGKRRLAAEAGELVAWRFQRLALASLMRELSADPRWTTWLAVTPDRPTGWVKPARPIAQGLGDLGARLVRLNRKLPPGAIAVVGSDAPQVRRSDVAAAFRTLTRADAVFGPSLDGGYWLVGLTPSARRTARFENVRWSTEHALSDTVANFRGFRVGYLRDLEDVDDAASLRRLGSRAGRRPAAL